MALKLRIVQIKDKFVVQIRKSWFNWEGFGCNFLYTWSKLEHQLEYCAFQSLEDAREFRCKILQWQEDKKIKVKVIE